LAEEGRFKVVGLAEGSVCFFATGFAVEVGGLVVVDFIFELYISNVTT
jgi:hypothetical protein